MAYWELHKSCSLSCTSEEPTAPVNCRNLCQLVCIITYGMCTCVNVSVCIIIIMSCSSLLLLCHYVLLLNALNVFIKISCSA